MRENCDWRKEVQELLVYFDSNFDSNIVNEGLIKGVVEYKEKRVEVDHSKQEAECTE